MSDRTHPSKEATLYTVAAPSQGEDRPFKQMHCRTCQKPLQGYSRRPTAEPSDLPVGGWICVPCGGDVQLDGERVSGDMDAVQVFERLGVTRNGPGLSQ